jgi:hypothetical protein
MLLSQAVVCARGARVGTLRLICARVQRMQQFAVVSNHVRLSTLTTASVCSFVSLQLRAHTSARKKSTDGKPDSKMINDVVVTTAHTTTHSVRERSRSSSSRTFWTQFSPQVYLLRN